MLFKGRSGLRDCQLADQDDGQDQDQPQGDVSLHFQPESRQKRDSSKTIEKMIAIVEQRDQ